MLKNFVYVSVIVLHLLLCNYAIAAENETKPHSKNDSEPSAKSSTESKKDKEKFAAPLNDQESARTFLRPNLFADRGGPRIFPFQFGQVGQPTRFPKPFPGLFPNLRPIISQLPIIKPILAHFRPRPIAPVPVAPVAPFKPYPPIYSPPYSPPAISKPTVPFVDKPTFVVSQQVIHKPVVTEKIEIIRRPVISEVVEVVHKPIVSEVQQVIKHPTYIQHVVKKPIVNEVKNELVGSPVHLPVQHYEVQEKPQHVQPVTSEVIQIPHQHIETGYKPSYGIGSGYKPSYGIESGYRPSYSGYKPSYGVSSGLGGVGGIAGVGSSQGGFGSGYGSSSGVQSSYGSNYGTSYGVSSGLGGVGSSQGGFGSGYGSSSGVQSSYGSNYGTGLGYGGEYGGVEQTWVVPAPGCKSGECGLVTLENAIDPTDENLQSMNSPYPWYTLPSRDLYERNNGDEQLYDQGLPLQPSYYYMNPQILPDEQLLTDEQQNSKLNDFLIKNPTIKPILDDLYRKFVEAANSHIDAEKLASESSKGRSMNEENNSHISNEEEFNHAINFINSADEEMLKKLEERVKVREATLVNSIPKLGDVSSSSLGQKASAQ